MKYALVLLFAVDCGAANGTTTVSKTVSATKLTPTVEAFLAEVRAEMKSLETERVTPKLEAKEKKIIELYVASKPKIETEKQEDLDKKLEHIATTFGLAAE